MDGATTARLDFWFDFGSTYSYPTALRIGDVANKAGVSVVFRPLMLGAIFRTQGWDTSPFNIYEAKGRHMWRDLERITSEMGVPFVRPDPFPQNGLLTARVATAARDEAWQPQFCRTVFTLQFGDGKQINTPETVSEALNACGANAESWLSQSGTQDTKDRLRAETGTRRATRYLWRADVYYGSR